MRGIITLLCAIAGAVAAPVNEKRAAAPTVTIKNGTIVGSTTGTIDSFSGIPFAQPPVGSLRLKPPQSIVSGYSTLTATGTPTACPQFFSQVDTTNLPSDVIGHLLDSPLGQEISNAGEDCLTLNVQRPSGLNSSSKLPVVVWIFGGGFEFGSAETYNGKELIDRSVTLGHEVVYVAMNYRVSGFGFLAGKELQADGSTNLGLRDQRLAIEWVAENIEAFGGDPTKVTLWGESAGAISVCDHTVINGGDNTYNGKPLFRGGIMDSGSIIPALNVSHPKAQKTYDTVVENSGCSGANDTLACMRTLPYETFLSAVNSVPAIFSYTGLNLAYLPRPDPSSSFFTLSPDEAIYTGKYTKVPIISGDQEDEGTAFSLIPSANISTKAEADAYVAAIFPDNPTSMSNGWAATYPDKVSAGSPFRTGLENNVFPQYKRLAAMTGDIVFTIRRRVYLDAVASTLKAWTYLDTHLHGLPIIGTFHTSDYEAYFDDEGLPNTINTYLDYFISFFNYLDPNAISDTAPLINWPQYTTSDRHMLCIGTDSNSLITDTFRNSSSAYLEKHPSYFKV